ncbi:MAG: hypothetical protein MJE77_30645 [Proteobacteria bacterium]|nr:hypothetical protein [Pseudomonadota bacterium]
MTKKFIIAALISAGLSTACTNPDVPAGYEGYIHHVPLIFGKMEYRRALQGPASTSVSWRLFTINIDMRENTYREEFELLSSDDLKVSFEVSTRIRLRPNTVKEIVEDWGSKEWYSWNVKEPLRTIVRREVMKVSATGIQLRTNVIGKRIERALLEKYKDTPIDIQSVDIGSFEFPKEVSQAINEKNAKQQELERQAFILESTRKEAAIRVLEALKVAKKQRIISETLDPLYLQWRGVQVYRKLASSPNKTTILLPSTSEGTGIPQVVADGKRKVLSVEDEKYLREIEKRYMEKVAQAKLQSQSAGMPAPAQDADSDAPPSPPDRDAASSEQPGANSGAGQPGN